MSRFTLSTHDHPHPHWDLFLEQSHTETLRTWRLSRAPDGGQPQIAHLLPDHRPIYLDYEGPVSGNRGTVQRWDTGTYEPLKNHPDQVELKLQGARLNGRILLTKLSDSEWQYRYQSDDLS